MDHTERAAFPKKERIVRAANPGMQTFRIEVGHAHGVKPGNIVGAIANEAGLDSKNIGRIEIYDDYSVLDLPEDLPAALLDQLKTVWVAGQQLKISRDGAQTATSEKPAARKAPSPAIMTGIETNAHSDKFEHQPERAAPPKKERGARKADVAVQTYRIEVGHEHGVKPANIVGAIANEAGLEARHIGRIEIYDDHSTLDLPEGMPKELLDHLKSVWVAGHQLRISLAGEHAAGSDKFVAKKTSFSAGKTGGDRRVLEKKPGVKAHRKGPKPA
jgi:ATP-dependent RNA helicase DeaD